RRAQPGLMGAAVTGGYGVAIGLDVAVSQIPGHGPFHRAVGARPPGLAGEDVVDDARLPVEPAFHVVAQAAGEVERRPGGHLAPCQALVTGPADLHARKEIALCARHAE